MRILVLGAKGQLGQAVTKVGEAAGNEVIAWSRAEADVTQPAIAEQVAKVEADVVVNCAAWTNVDGAESNPDEAFRLNALAPRYIGEGCAASGAHLIQVSSNEVFAGDPGRFYYEYEECAPGGVYARSKRAGEVAAFTSGAKVLIARVAWLFGPGGANFPSKIVAAAKKNGGLRIVSDEYSNPTYSIDAAIAMLQLAAENRTGIFHVTNEGYASRFALAEAVLSVMGMCHVPLTPIKANEWQRATLPPLHAVLVNQAARAVGVTLRPWQDAVTEYASYLLQVKES